MTDLIEMRIIPEVSDERFSKMQEAHNRMAAEKRAEMEQSALEMLFPPIKLTAGYEITEQMLDDVCPGKLYTVEGLNPREPEVRVIPHVVFRRLAWWIGNVRDLLGSWARRWCTQSDCFCGGCD